jgi:hypothetical protein
MPETPKELYSHHVFMLPFKWSGASKSQAWVEKKDFDTLVKKLPEYKWGESKFNIDTILNYNEFHYFYDYVRQILYDIPRNSTNSREFIRHFEFNSAKDGIFRITTPKPGYKNAKKEYELLIDSVLLHLYDTGVGVLSFHLENRRRSQRAPEDILYINQFGRRVFPPFFSIPAKKTGTSDQFHEKDFANNLPTGKELAYKLEIEINGGIYPEEWEGYLNERLKTDSQFDFKLPLFLNPFLSPVEKLGYQIEPILDDRMFVVCWYGNAALAEAIKNNRIQSDDWWYRFVYIDGSLKTVQNAAMQAQLIEKATNARWNEFGSFYGVTDYSFVMLTAELSHLRRKGIDAAFLVNHLQTIYYKMSELTLVQRATVQKFSDEAADISQLEIQGKQLPDKVAELHRRYIRFVNRIYFREVTAQVQGIELYDKLHEQCRLREQVESLKQEIDELHTYVDQAQEMKRNNRLEQLTLLGTILLPPSLILAVFGVNTINEVNSACERQILWWLLIITLTSSFLSFFAYWVKPKILKIILTVLLVLVMLAGIYSPVYFVSKTSCREQTEQIKPSEEPSSHPQIPTVIDTIKTINNEQ